MAEAPLIAAVAALIGDPARANMLTALMDGRALTASELAGAGGITLQTASGHLARLREAGLIAVRKQGRHRYFSLSGPDVAQVIEALMGLAQRTGAVPTRTGPRDAAMRAARVCYDHLAGERGVAMLHGLRQRGIITGDDETLRLTEIGRKTLADFGLDLGGLEAGRRPLCRPCLDWSERQSHLGGALGAALLDAMVDRGWVKRGEGRALRFSPQGVRQFDTLIAE